MSKNKKQKKIQLETLLTKIFLPASINIDAFENSQMAKTRPLIKNTLYKWYGWLISYILEFMKKSVSDIKETIMKLFETNVHKNIFKDYNPKKLLAPLMINLSSAKLKTIKNYQLKKTLTMLR